jgi:hypothetical protein
MTFPARQPVIHRPYIGLDLDELNNEIPAWDDPVPVKVIGYKITTSQTYSGDRRTRGMWASRQISEGLLTYPPDLEVNVRDRFTLSDGLDYEVDEVRLLRHFLGWNPGGVAKLKRINPTGKPVAAD